MVFLSCNCHNSPSLYFLAACPSSFSSPFLFHPSPFLSSLSLSPPSSLSSPVPLLPLSLSSSALPPPFLLLMNRLTSFLFCPWGHRQVHSGLWHKAGNEIKHNFFLLHSPVSLQLPESGHWHLSQHVVFHAICSHPLVSMKDWLQPLFPDTALICTCSNML